MFKSSNFAFLGVLSSKNKFESTSKISAIFFSTLRNKDFFFFTGRQPPRLQSACVDHGRHTHSQEWQGEYTLQSFLVTSLRPPSCTHTLTRTATSLPCSFPMLTRSSTSTDLTFFSTRPDIQRISLWHIVIDAKSNDLAPPTVRRRQ